MNYGLTWDGDFSEGNLSNFTHNVELPRHRWFNFKEGFSSELIRRAIESAPQRNRALRILDPFGGSGTTALVASMHGHQATAVEVNPFLHFVASAKCTASPQNPVKLRGIVDDIMALRPREIESPLEQFSTFGPREGSTKWLFNRSVLRGYQALREHISGAESCHGPLFLALLEATMDCCNARRDGKCLRYKKNWETLGYSSLELRDRFELRVHNVIADLMDVPLQIKPNLINGDARRILSVLSPSSFDLILFSPPYLNSFDYSDLYRPEMFLGEFVKSNLDLRRIRAKTLRSHIQYNWDVYSQAPVKEVARVADILRSRSEKLWDKRIPAMVESYFADLKTVLDRCDILGACESRMWIVVSTSAYGGVEIPVDLLLAQLATLSGWKLDSIKVLRYLRPSSQNPIIDQNTRKKARLRESLIQLYK